MALGLFVAKIAFRCRRVSLYIAVAGGRGQYVDLLFAALGRLRGRNLILHHHSFAYLDHPRLSAKLLARVCGSRCIHVALCQHMSDLLCQHYTTLGQIRLLSNAALLAAPLRQHPKAGPLRVLGFLGNITRDKGIDQFLELVSQLRAEGSDLVGRVAGPITDEKCRDMLDAAVATGAVFYDGPVYDERKERFFADIDVLVFPSRYANEAEPFVVIEALAAGVPVIATARGCIPSLVDDHVGLSLDPSGTDLQPAVRIIRDWVADPDKFAAASASAITAARRSHASATAALNALISEMAPTNPQ